MQMDSCLWVNHTLLSFFISIFYESILVNTNEAIESLGELELVWGKLLRWYMVHYGYSQSILSK